MITRFLTVFTDTGGGWVFTQNHIQGLGGRAAIDSALRRLVSEGTIRRISRGLYDYPIQDLQLGLLTPSADATARALATRDAIRLQPSGVYAANIRGVPKQVPSRIVFRTDGPARKDKLGNHEIHLQHTTPRNMATAGRERGALIQALRYIGQDQVIAALSRHIGASDRNAIQKDLRHAPAWIADLLRPLTEPTS